VVFSNAFLDGSEIELKNALLYQDDPVAFSKRGFLDLQVYRQGGRLRLARNEAADWYYDPVK